MGKLDPSTTDFNTIIANYERSFGAKAEEAAEMATRYRAAAAAPNKAIFKDVNLKRAAECDTRAAYFRERQAVAKDGYLLVSRKDIGDYRWMQDHRAVYHAAQQASRVKWGERAAPDPATAGGGLDAAGGGSNSRADQETNR